MENFKAESATQQLQSGRVINIVYYTDPLCCFSWALEPELVQLEKEWPGTISWRHCMGGLLPGWKFFADNQNSILRPAQMGPLWMYASEQLKLELAYKVWVEDPPASSYPACIAVKCAELQSPTAGKIFLYLARKAVMKDSLNIAKQEVLYEVARCVSEIAQGFSVSQFMHDMQSGRALEAFRKDLQEVKYRNINRFPTLLIQRPSAHSLLLTGYRPANVLLQIINEA